MTRQLSELERKAIFQAIKYQIDTAYKNFTGAFILIEVFLAVFVAALTYIYSDNNRILSISVTVLFVLFLYFIRIVRHKSKIKVMKSNLRECIEVGCVYKTNKCIRSSGMNHKIGVSVDKNSELIYTYVDLNSFLACHNDDPKNFRRNMLLIYPYRKHKKSVAFHIDEIEAQLNPMLHPQEWRQTSDEEQKFLKRYLNRILLHDFFSYILYFIVMSVLVIAISVVMIGSMQVEQLWKLAAVVGIIMLIVLIIVHTINVINKRKLYLANTVVCDNVMYKRKINLYYEHTYKTGNDDDLRTEYIDITYLYFNVGEKLHLGEHFDFRNPQNRQYVCICIGKNTESQQYMFVPVAI